MKKQLISNSLIKKIKSLNSLNKFSSNSLLVKKNFGYLSYFDQNNSSYRMTKYDPQKELEGHNPIVSRAESDRFDYKIRKLNNGITVVTETTNFPTAVNMGILLAVGVRDETAETSGACHAFKNTYLKTIKHTNETINYGMIQMSGGETSMEYDEENIFYKTTCFDYDTIDMFRMISDMAFEPRTILSSNVSFSFYSNITYFY